MSITAAELVAKVVADTSAAERDLRGFSSRMASGSGPLGGLGQTVAGVFGGNLMTGAVQGLGRGIVNLGQMGVGALGEMLSAGADFEAQMDGISAVLGGTAGEMSALGDLVIGLGMDPNLKVNTEEAAAAVQNLATQGLTAQEILDGAAYSTILLANATGADFGSAATTAVDAMRLFNIDAANMDEAINGIVGVANVSKFDLNDYALAIAQAGGVASLSGVDFDDFNATIAASSNYFASGSDAGTSFKTFLQRLQPTTQEARDMMYELGLVTEDGRSIFYDTTGQLKDMGDVVDIMNDTFGNMTEAQRSFYLGQIFGTDAMRTAGALAEITEQQFRGLQDEMGRTDALESAKTRMDNLKGALEILGGSFEAVKTKIGNALAPLAQTIVEAFTPVIDWAAPYLEGWTNQFVGWAERQVEDIKFRGNAAKVAFDNAFNWSQEAGQPINMSWAAGIDAAVEQFFGPSSAIAKAANRLPELVNRFNESGGGFSGWATAVAMGAGMLAGADEDMDAFSTSLGELDDAIGEYSKGGGEGLFTAIVGGVGLVTGARVTFENDTKLMKVAWDNFALTLQNDALSGFEWGSLKVNWQEGTITVGGQDIGAWLNGSLSAEKLQGYFKAGVAAVALQMDLKVKPFLEDGSASMGAWLDKSAASIGDGLGIKVVPFLEDGSASMGAWLDTQAANLEAAVKMIPVWAAEAVGFLQDIVADVTMNPLWGDTWTTLYTAIASIWPDWGSTWSTKYSADSTVVADWGSTWTTIYDAAANIKANWGGIWDKVYNVWVRFTGVNDVVPGSGGSGAPAGAGGTGAPGTGGGLSPGGSGLPQWDYNAMGNPLFRGGWTMVGERGPELVRLPRASRIYNDRDSQGMAGGPTININSPVRSDADLEMLIERVSRRAFRRGRL